MMAPRTRLFTSRPWNGRACRASTKAITFPTSSKPAATVRFRLQTSKRSKTTICRVRLRARLRLLRSGAARAVEANIQKRLQMTNQDFLAAAELYLGSDRQSAAAHGPRMFRSAAKALRFAIEEAAPVSLHGAGLRVG